MTVSAIAASEPRLKLLPTYSDMEYDMILLHTDIVNPPIARFENDVGNVKAMMKTEILSRNLTLCAAFQLICDFNVRREKVCYQ